MTIIIFYVQKNTSFSLILIETKRNRQKNYEENLITQGYDYVNQRLETENNYI